MLIIADDSEANVGRLARDILQQIRAAGTEEVVAVEFGSALRNSEEEGIEHFGYVDGRSQPLFLASDFVDLDPKTGDIDPAKTKEKVNDKAKRRESGDLSIWNPFATLDLALLKDPGVSDPEAFGSYFVFRKLEQDVLRFSIAEQQLADALELEGNDRERAGAMAVGRFRDGTPLVQTPTDGAVPAKANNFRYDGLDFHLQKNAASVDDRLGLRCPFQSHIRKTNPRQSADTIRGRSTEEQEAVDRSRRIVRRGIPYGKREKHPDAFQSLDDLPTGGVGLLFACFQSSILRQFAFMQTIWANNPGFRVPIDVPPPGADPVVTGIDPLIGQAMSVDKNANPPQHWRKEYDGDQSSPPVLEDVPLLDTHPTSFKFSHFVKFRGGEFFFAPSLPFFESL